MAKELPYFQFEPAEYLTKDVSFCSLEAQGFFINLCSYYWQRECELTEKQLLKRLNHVNLLNELVEENVIKVVDNQIKVSFLDAQYEKATSTSKTNSINGSKGGRPKKKKPNETEIKPKLNPIKSESKGIREDKIREDKIKEELLNKKKSLFSIFWKKYPKKVAKVKCEGKFIKLSKNEINDIMNSLDKFIAHKPFEEYNHPNPETYLNQRRWEDEIPEPKDTRTAQEIYNAQLKQAKEIAKQKTK